MTFRSRPLLDLARGAPCTVRLPCCDGGGETSVWAHSDSQIHGKGMAEKAHDCFGAVACGPCHSMLPTLDRNHREEAMREAMDRTLLWLWSNGLITVANTHPRAQPPKRIAKVLSRDAAERRGW